MDARITDDERIGRGVGIQAQHYVDRRNFEQDAHPKKKVFPRNAKRTALLGAALLRGHARKDSTGETIPQANDDPPSSVDLFRIYEPTGRSSTGSWLHRNESGPSHGRQWAVHVNMERASATDEHGNAFARVTADHAQLEVILGLAVVALTRAADAHAFHHAVQARPERTAAGGRAVVAVVHPPAPSRRQTQRVWTIYPVWCAR